MNNQNNRAGPHMEPQVRLKTIAENASGISINPSIKATQYVRSGKEMLRSAINYHEDGNPEHAYILYMRFLTIFLDKLRHHPGFKEIPPAEKKLMNSYCNDILPKAEVLKTELLNKYAKDHEEYQVFLKECIKKAEQARDEAKKKAERDGKHLPNNSGSDIPWKWESNWPYDNLPATPSAPFLPDPKSLAMSGSGSPLSGVSYSNILDEVNEVSPSGSSGVPHPQFDRSTKPGRFLSPMSSGLRDVVVPGDLTAVFLRLAEKNTKRNVETCGFLTGKINGGKLVITDLIVPKQDGTADSCTTSPEAEVEIFVVQDKFDLITFGWIHTHPSQTAFLSSIDMHTHHTFQSMMPEAIAIVCAPSKNETGVFVLTAEDGMDIIGNCTKTNFHPHPQTGSPLFTSASHYVFDQSKSVRVHDLRY